MINKYPQVILNPGKDQSLRRFHPWVFSGAIKRIEGKVEEGDVVEVFSNKMEYLATGHCQSGTIAVRIFSFEQVQPGIELWKNKILKAYNCRKQIGLIDNPDTNVFRLMFGEGDGMPALIIDFYNGTAVLQTYSVGMHLIKNDIVTALLEIFGNKLHAIYDKSGETMPQKTGIKVENTYLFGKPGTFEVKEYGNKFLVDWESGQKTGFFIDQRENRKLLAQYAKDKNVLNTFCYTGGFSVYALNAGAKLVHSVDSSQKAMEMTDKNIELNKQTSNHQSFTADVFDYVKNIDDQYDIIVLDPPAFAKSRNVSHNAVQGYKRINAEAIRKIKKGGLLFTFSCSQVINRVLFYNTVIAAAIEAGRNARVVHHLSQPPDHPVNIFHPEGEYLKGLVLYIE